MNFTKFIEKHKTNSKSWYEQANRGASWKSILQFDIDRMIKQSKDWDEFLKKMAKLVYEIKYGKHIAFKYKYKERFTRAKTIGEDYTEERLKERISENANQKTFAVKKRVGNIIDIANNEKAQSSKGYEFWATKHNLQVASDTVILMREKGFKSLAQLDDFIKKSADKRQSLQDEIKVLEEKITALSATMEQVHTVTKHHQIYQAYKKEPTDKAFTGEHKAEILLHEKALADLKKSYSKMPNSKQIFEELEKNERKKNPLCKSIFHQNLK